MFDETIKLHLSKPLDAQFVAKREQSGRQLSYIEGHHAIREANRIFGFDGWSRETGNPTQVQCELKEGKSGPMWYVGYVAHSVVVAHGVARTGIGFGQGIDKDLGKAHESAIKEAETDAMKRALMTFGDPFGLALYDKSQEHVVTKPTPKDLQKQFGLNESNTAPVKAAAERDGKKLSDYLLEAWEYGARTYNDLLPKEVA
jgi:DNA repair and recombination protein RAD52